MAAVDVRFTSPEGQVTDSLEYLRTTLPFLLPTRSGLFLTYQQVDDLNQHLIWLTGAGAVIRDLTLDYRSIQYAFATGDTVTLVEHLIEMRGDSTYYNLVAHSYDGGGDLVARDTLWSDLLGLGSIVAGYAFQAEQGRLTAAVITADADHVPVLYTAHIARYTVTGGATVYESWDPGPVPAGSYIDYWAIAEAPGGTVLAFHIALDGGSELWFQAVDDAGSPLRYLHQVTLGTEQLASGLNILAAYGSVYAMYTTFSPFNSDWQGGYILGFPLETVLTAGETPRGVPAAHGLAAYPNPFNAETSIPFRLWRSGPVTVRIYNLIGEQVATVIDDIRPTGDYEVHWSAGELPSGIYLTKVETPGYVNVQKLVLLK